jgi:hypothetical protein
VDYAKLLLEVELALVLEHCATNIVIDLPFEAQQLDLARKQLAQEIEQLSERAGLEKGLSELEPHGDVRRDSERLSLSGVSALDDRDDLGRNAPVETDVFLERVHYAAADGFGLWILRAAAIEWKWKRGRAEHISGGDVTRDAGAGDSFDEHARGASRESRDLDDASDDARSVQVSGRWFLFLSVALGDQQDDLVIRHRRFDCGQRRRSPHEERNYYIGENDNIPKRKDRDAVRRRDGLVVALKSLRQTGLIEN